MNGYNCLVHSFPRLYLLSNNKDVIGDMGMWREDRWNWEFNWRRVTFEWENELIHQLNFTFKSCIGTKEWIGFLDLEKLPLGEYTTKSAYKLVIEDAGTLPPSDLFSLLWQIKIPNKVAFLL